MINMCTRRALGKVKAEVEEFPPSRDNHTGGPVGGGGDGGGGTGT